MSDEYPNLFEKQCDESEQLQALKEAIHAIREAREYTQDALGGKAVRNDEQLAEAQQEVQEVTNRVRSDIAVRLAAKYTRNPDYRDNEVSDSGVIEEFEEWQLNHDRCVDRQEPLIDDDTQAGDGE